MSMLAERKRKQRWSLNPRGKEWSEDSSKFGQKLLEKLGWKHGKGLGANEDGLTEHVKVNYKNDQKGMGYKETEQWTEHEDHFTQLLNKLNGDSNDNSKNDQLKVSSLHEKAENVKTRINYHKFTKGKDLSRYSEKDLANIFGRKKLNKDVKNKNEENDDDDTNDDNTKEKEGNLINKGSITDYFKKKLPQFGIINNMGVKIGNNGVLTKESSDTESEKCFGFGFNNNPTLNESINDETLRLGEKDDGREQEINVISDEKSFDGEKCRKKKKKSKKNKGKNENVEEIVEIDEEPNLIIKEKKKKKSKHNDNDDEIDLNSSNKRKLPQELNDDDEPPAKKKKSKKNKGETENVVEILEIEEEPNLIIKKKKKNKHEIDNEKIDEINTSKKKKKKSKHTDNNVEIDLNSSNKRKLPQELNDDDEPPAKKKKSKKNKNNDQIDESTSGIINPGFNPNFNQSIDLELRKRTKVIIEYENDDIKNDSKSEKASKKSKLEKGIVNPTFEDLLPKNEINGVDNPTLTVIEDSDLTLNVVTTPILKSERSISRSRKSVRFSKSNQERIIPNNYMQERNELFDINTLVVEESIKEELKNNTVNNGFVNNGFDIRAIDKLNFFDTDEKGIDNPCFQPKKLDDNVNALSQRVDNFEAKLDNDINEYKSTYQEVFVGCNDSISKSIQVSEGVRLSFQNVSFGRSPHWMKRAATDAKKSYKHLIKGDVIIAFKSSNLHKINGYGVQNGNE